MGQALTLSGDDPLSAFCYTLHALDSPYGGFIGLAWELVNARPQQAELPTNRISSALLSDHAHGDAAGPLRELAVAALDARFVGGLDPLVARGAGIGQSPGWDEVIGVRCTCSIAAGMPGHGPVAVSIPSGRAET